jgi:hypothetical protein
MKRAKSAHDQALIELARGLPPEELAHYVQRGRKGMERNRFALQAIRKLAMRDSRVPLDRNQGSLAGRRRCGKKHNAR